MEGLGFYFWLLCDFFTSVFLESFKLFVTETDLAEEAGLIVACGLFLPPPGNPPESKPTYWLP